MIDGFLVAPNTTVTTKGDGSPLDVSFAAHRVFLLTLHIEKIIEQQSLDLSIFGSTDGANWTAKPLAAFPQKFYTGDHPLLLDLTTHSDIKSLRAHWSVNRWGRGTEVPMFQFSVSIKEVPADLLKEATAEAQALA